MWANSYFGRFWGDRYWASVGAVLIEIKESVTVSGYATNNVEGNAYKTNEVEASGHAANTFKGAGYL